MLGLEEVWVLGGMEMDGARLHSSPGLGVNSRLVVLFFLYFEPKFDHSAIKNTCIR